jgi:glycosyltransferase involved in cell wall biosynthesis
MKICHVITRLDMGGSAQNTLATCRCLGSKYETILVYGASEESSMTECEMASVVCGTDEACTQGVRLQIVPALVRRISPVNDFRALLELLRIIRRERPDIVHTHTSKAGIVGRLAARLAGVPKIIHTAHGHVFYGHFGKLASAAFLAMEKIFARFTDQMVALTAGEADDYVKLSVAPQEKIEIIHSGVDICESASVDFAPAAKRVALGLKPEGVVIGFVGWLLPIKGPVHLLNAMLRVWQRHPDARLVFVGKGDQEQALRELADRLSLHGRVKLLGWRDDVNEIMSIFDIFVLPSLNEGMGRVLVEAMAAGKPVVASNVGGIPDLIKNGVNGILVPPGDERALAEGINALIEDQDLADRMGAAGKGGCCQFSLEAMISRIDALYQRVGSTIPHIS